MRTRTPRTPRGITVVFLVTGLLCSGEAMAQQAGAAELLRRIDALETELAVLKAQVESMRPDPPQGGQAGRPSADPLQDLKVGVALDTYYEFNFNRPIGRVNLLRAYDVTSNNFSLNQASVVIDRAPDLDAGRRFGGRLDFQYGQATETLQGSLASEPRPWVYRNLFQAYGTYVAPVGSGLTIDFGKWASALGIEGNYTKDQLNYSRSYLFDFLPFYHMGARATYRLNDRVALSYWITNGTQQTEAFNNFKDQFAGVVLQPSKKLTWNVQYYLGQEHPDVQQIQVPGIPTSSVQPGLSITPVVPYFTGKLHIWDTYAAWQPTPGTTVAFEADHVVSRNPAPARDFRVSGAVAYYRRRLTDRTAVAARGEYVFDDGGLFTGRTQKLKAATLTYDYKVSEGFLVRGEWRRDSSSVPFFLTRDAGVLDASQDTGTLGLIWWWGTKRQVW